jgi:preprotein translocase subunit SecA
MAEALRLARTAFPEREDRKTSFADRIALGWWLRAQRALMPNAAREVTRLAALSERDGPALRRLSDADLAGGLRRAALPGFAGREPNALDQALLHVAEAARRTIGLQPYPVQLFGARVLIDGRLAEMQTGEGKTLTAGLAACIAGAAGVPVHVVTVNDYLAQRDHDTLAPLMSFVGLSTGVVRHGIERPGRAAAYAADVAWCTNKELVFDYLRDRVDAKGRASAAQLAARRLYGDATPPPLLRGLHFAIVDEADSILIDEARTPLILAEKAGAIEHAEALPQGLRWAAELERDRHFTLDLARKEVRLADAGRDWLAERCRDARPPWRAAHEREHLIVQALRALHVFRRDEQYLVDGEGAVQIIDEYTGRVLPGRTWEQGLHQMIETKEGVKLTEQTRTLARITYQRYFARYLRLAGMTGTAREMAGELASVYRLQTVTVPTHRPNRRTRLKDRLTVDQAAKWEATAAEAARLHARGQPVLIGTRSVEASEALSAVLARHGLPHQVLNARQDQAEAEIVERAGARGAITVATNMAGRGTDIGLGEGVAKLGGLCVILTEFHESPRIDRQLFGRCARQGDPGTTIAIVAVDDDLFVRHGGAEAALLKAPGATLALPRVCAAAQKRAERMHARTRRDTLKADRDLEQLMSISGDPT